MAETKHITTTDRRVQVYPRPFYKKLLEAYAARMGGSVSGATNTIIENFFNSMPYEEQEKLLKK